MGVYDNLYLDLANRHGTLKEVLEEERLASRAEGIKAGKERLAKLTALLLQEGRTLKNRRDFHHADFLLH